MRPLDGCGLVLGYNDRLSGLYGWPRCGRLYTIGRRSTRLLKIYIHVLLCNCLVIHCNQLFFQNWSFYRLFLLCWEGALHTLGCSCWFGWQVLLVRTYSLWNRFTHLNLLDVVEHATAIHPKLTAQSQSVACCTSD